MKKFNVGCGPRDFGSDWIHVDGGDYPHLDSKDILLKDYEDGCADLIYASHVIEYFDRIMGQGLILTWKDKLKEGGILRLSVPDFETLAKLYVEGKCILYDIIGPLYGRMKMGDEWIYHRTAYDYHTLFELLYSCGFTRIKTWVSDYADFSTAKKDFRLISLNMEGVK